MYCIYLTPCINYRAKTSNNINEFVYSNWIHYNLEHGLAIITESFSPLNLNYATSLVKVQARSDMTNHAIPDTDELTCALTGPNQVLVPIHFSQ